MVQKSMGAMLSAGVLVLSAGLAVGQVMPPPPAPAEPEPEYQPPAPPQPAPRPGGQPQSGGDDEPQVRTSGGMQGDLSNMEFHSLAEVGEDGRIVRLDFPVHYLALQRNPTVGHVTAERLPQHLMARRARFEGLLVDHLEDLEMLEGGLLDEISINNREVIAQLNTSLRNLRGPTTLSQELRSKGVLTSIQQRMNEQVVNDYQSQVREEIMAESEDGLGDMLRFMANMALVEVRDARSGLVLEGSRRIERVLDHMGGADITPLTEAQRGSIIGAVNAHDEDAQIERLAAVSDALMGLDIDQRRAFYRSVFETRASRFQPPMVFIDVTEGKRITQHAPADVRQPGGGR